MQRDCASTLSVESCKMLHSVCISLCLAILVELRLVTDTERHRAIAYTMLSTTLAVKILYKHYRVLTVHEIYH